MIKKSIIRTYTDNRGWQNYTVQVENDIIRLSVRATGYIGLDYKIEENIKSKTPRPIYLTIWSDGLISLTVSDTQRLAIGSHGTKAYHHRGL